MRKNEHIALSVLCASGAVLAASVPFAHTFAGGLCASGALAGLIGGLADWFAVSAIFTKPLGIGFKTNLIVANRDQLAKGVGRMVSEELLTSESVESFLAKRDLATMAVVMFDKLDGRRYLRAYVTQAVVRVLSAVDVDAVARLVGDALQSGLSSADWRSGARNAVRAMATEGRLDAIGRILYDEVCRIAESDELYTASVAMAEEALRAYEQESAGRQFVHSMMDLSPERCGQMAVRAVSSYLASGDASRRGSDWLERAILLVIDTIDDGVIDAGKEKVELTLRQYLADMREAVCATPEEVSWLKGLIGYAEDAIDSLILDRQRNESFNRSVRKVIATFLTKHQAELSRLAEGGVNRLSDQELTGFLRAKVGHDLQMIRVNGSLVGALVGAVLYLLRYAYKAVML